MSFEDDNNNRTGGHQALQKRNVSIFEAWFIAIFEDNLTDYRVNQFRSILVLISEVQGHVIEFSMVK